MANVITGIHAVLFSKHADKIRRFLSAVLELRSVDAGEGWPIFAAPPTELAVHPAEDELEYELYLMCDDVKAAIATLAERGFKSEPVEERSWGLATAIRIAEGASIGLYEPRHPSPFK